MIHQLVIIGAGQQGSRHLQSLAQLDKCQYQIFVFDPSQNSLDIAQQRYLEVINDYSPEVFYSIDFDSIPKHIKVAIIATNSKVRRDVIEKLLSQSQVEHLILEKNFFPVVKDYTDILQLLNEKQVNTFVNTPRRTYPFYEELKQNIETPFHLEVSGSLWGIGCNAIHFLDLFYYLNGHTSLEILNLLDSNILESKRSGYIEFTGSLFIKDKNNNTCQLMCYNEGESPSVVSYTDSYKKIYFHENQLRKVSFISNGDKYDYQEEPISPPRQSDLTASIITDLVHNGTCNITTYQDSMYLHLQLLEQYLETYSKHTKQKEESCPIT